MNAVGRYQVLDMYGWTASGLGAVAGMCGFLATGIVRHTRALTGVIRTMTVTRMAGTITRATGIVRTMAITTGTTGIVTAIMTMTVTIGTSI